MEDFARQKTLDSIGRKAGGEDIYFETIWQKRVQKFRLCQLPSKRIHQQSLSQSDDR